MNHVFDLPSCELPADGASLAGSHSGFAFVRDSRESGNPAPLARKGLKSPLHPRLPARAGQRGVALVVALILLLIITIVGLAAVRGTIMQQKMAANMYDRQIAFQNAEAALREAAASIPTSPGNIARNCNTASVICLANPFEDSNLPAGGIHTLAKSQYTAGSRASGQPQYVIENMGDFTDTTSDTGFGQSANSHNYGVDGGTVKNIYYRVTARSGDPAEVGERAVVVLQAMIKQS